MIFYSSWVDINVIANNFTSFPSENTRGIEDWNVGQLAKQLVDRVRIFSDLQTVFAKTVLVLYILTFEGICARGNSFCFAAKRQLTYEATEQRRFSTVLAFSLFSQKVQRFLLRNNNFASVSCVATNLHV